MFRLRPSLSIMLYQCVVVHYSIAILRYYHVHLLVLIYYCLWVIEICNRVYSVFTLQHMHVGCPRYYRNTQQYAAQQRDMIGWIWSIGQFVIKKTMSWVHSSAKNLAIRRRWSLLLFCKNRPGIRPYSYSESLNFTFSTPCASADLLLLISCVFVSDCMQRTCGCMSFACLDLADEFISIVT